MPQSATLRSRPSDAGASGASDDLEPVEVRRAPGESGAPVQLLWRGDLWLVRDALAERCPAGGSSECWWVVAGRGPRRPADTFRLWRDAGERWWLEKVQSPQLAPCATTDL